MMRPVFWQHVRWSHHVSSRFCPHNSTPPAKANKETKEEAAHLIAAVTATLVALTTPFLLPTADTNNTSCESAGSPASECTNDDDIVRRCILPWVTDTLSTKAECSIHETTGELCRKGSVNEDSTFDPASSDYFDIKLVATNESDNLRHPLLHNTIVVIPNLITAKECEMIVKDAERILKEKKAENIKGVTTESWTVYSRFNNDCQQVMDRVLGKHVLAFIQQRLPEIAERLFGHDTLQLNSIRSKGSAKETMDYCWDDPVVIKYIAGNKLAPHEDMRELTIVVPLNPLGTFPLVGGGTRFWADTSPEQADSNSGVSLQPSAGTGIIFNGDVTHSGNAVHAGTRFVLMTSITLDDDDYGAEEDDDANADAHGSNENENYSRSDP